MTPKNLAETFGGVCRATRLRMELTQADVAELVDLAVEVYGRLERGDGLPSLPKFRAICAALHLDAKVALGLLPSPQVPVAQAPKRPIDMAKTVFQRQLIRVTMRLSQKKIRALRGVALAMEE